MGGGATADVGVRKPRDESGAAEQWVSSSEGEQLQGLDSDDSGSVQGEHESPRNTKEKEGTEKSFGGDNESSTSELRAYELGQEWGWSLEPSLRHYLGARHPTAIRYFKASPPRGSCKKPSKLPPGPA